MNHQRFSVRLRHTNWFDFGDGERLLWYVVLLTLVGDLLTTYYGLQAGMVETNPVAREGLIRYGFASLVALKLFALGVGVVCRSLVPSRYTAIVPAGLALPWTFAVLVNLSLFVRL